MASGLYELKIPKLPGQQGHYRGKVREVFDLGDRVAMVATDRISAFDHILPKAIPFKGQVLNQTAQHFLEATRHLVPNWLEAVPHPYVSIGQKAAPYKVEMVIRGYLTGHAWREYRQGKRTLCGVAMPDGLRENDPFPEPIITPATKAEEGHDEDISREDIVAQGIVPEEDYLQLEAYTRQLFSHGTSMAAEQGLILVDTKYEFGKTAQGKIVLIDEVHTPDSSRYFYSQGYQERQDRGEAQQQLSKEFVRQWLISEGFQGLEGQTMPTMPDELVVEVSQRYIKLYERVCGKEFVSSSLNNLADDIFSAITNHLSA